MFFGPNASGKTSILEALFLLSHSRSFRSSRITEVIRRGSRTLRIRAEIHTARRGRFSVGIERGPALTRVRCNAENLRRTTDQAQLVQLCLVTPESHELVEGSPQGRRRWLDWGMFHVEPHYLESWRRYYGALRQRNSLLRAEAPDEQFSPWERIMEEAAQELYTGRKEYLQQFKQALQKFSCELLVMPLGYRISHGWDEQKPLARLLKEERPQDREASFTRSGPHRLEIFFCGADGKTLPQLSRGQQKLLALAMNMAQAHVFWEKTGERPVFLIDDLASELDARSNARVLDLLAQTAAQTFLTATQKNMAPVGAWPESAVFHVEQGKIRPAEGK